MTTKILPDSIIPSEGTDVDCVQTGEVIQAKIYDCEFWSFVE